MKILPFLKHFVQKSTFIYCLDEKIGVYWIEFISAIFEQNCKFVCSFCDKVMKRNLFSK